MTTARSILAAAGAAALLLFASAAQAAPACTATTAEMVRADETLFMEALSAVNSGGGYPAVRRFKPRLERALRHAPVTAEDASACTAFDWGNSGYGLAAFLVGGLEVEADRPERAWAALNQGLVITPDDPMLIGEASHVLTMLGRWDESLKLCEDTLARLTDVAPVFRARLLRCKGAVYIHRSSWDQAEQAYRASLEADPRSPVAASQLDLIAQVRRGEVVELQNQTVRADGSAPGEAPKQ